jgi:hypothetical protein
VSMKRKAVPQHTYGGAGEKRYSSYSLTTSALDGGDWSYQYRNVLSVSKILIASARN